MSEFNYTQLPPDGTGKRVATTKVIELLFDYAAYGKTFSIGDTVTTSDSNLNGSVIRIKGNEIYVLCNTNFNTNNLVVDEKILVDGVNFADYKQLKEDVNVQQTVITGGNNPLNRASVNDQGALTTTFASGDPLFDAFGKLQTSESTTIREYQPTVDTMPDEFFETTTLGSTITFDNTRHVVELSTPSGNTGAIARRRTNLYHKYQTGVATTVLFSAFLGDTGKLGVTRRIGIFDDNDGLYFHADENNPNGMGVVVRSSVSGSIVETHAHQNSWNIDRLDGSGGTFNLSRKSLDPTKTQVMFIDFQWLGAGRVRFGFVIDGEPIVCHQFNHANNASNPYMRTGTLPLTMEQENTGSPSSPSFMYIIAAAVKCEGKFSPREWVQGGVSPDYVPITDDVDFEHVLSFRAAQTLSAHSNRAVSIPLNIHITDITGNGKPVIIEIVKNDTLTGTQTWSDPYPNNALESISPESPLAGNVTGTSGGEVLMTDVVMGHKDIDMSKFFDIQSQLIIRKADITATPDHFTVRAKVANNGETATLVCGMTWKEYR